MTKSVSRVFLRGRTRFRGAGSHVYGLLIGGFSRPRGVVLGVDAYAPPSFGFRLVSQPLTYASGIRGKSGVGSTGTYSRPETKVSRGRPELQANHRHSTLAR